MQYQIFPKTHSRSLRLVVKVVPKDTLLYNGWSFVGRLCTDTSCVRWIFNFHQRMENKGLSIKYTKWNKETRPYNPTLPSWDTTPLQSSHLYSVCRLNSGSKVRDRRVRWRGRSWSSERFNHGWPLLTHNTYFGGQIQVVFRWSTRTGDSRESGGKDDETRCSV